MHIYRYHKAQLGSTIIGFHGSFVHGDVPVIVLEYAEYGSLEDFYRTIEPPQDGHAIIHLWRAVLQLCSGLCAIHNISPVNQDDERFHSVLRGWHQDIKPGNILVTRGVSGVGDGYSFRLADLGTTHFTRMPDATDEELRDADAGGTKAYGAPECYRSNHLAEEMTLRIGQNVDIWSLGAVLSEFAVWLVCGLVELNKYRLTREAATESLADPGCFHDGHGQLLPCVREFNKRAIDNRRMGDRITKKVLQQLIDGMLFVESTARPSAQYLVQKSGDILDTAQTNLIQQQNSSPAAHNSPHEQQQYHNGHQSLPILSLPSPIETSPSLNGMHSSPPELTPTDAFMNGSSDLGVELEGPVTPTPLSNKRRPVHIQVTESNGHSTRNHSPCSRDQTQANSRKERILSPDGSINGVTDPEDQKPEHASTYPSTPDASEHDEVDDPLPIESGPVTPGPNVSTSSAPGLTLGSLATYRQHMKSGSSKHATLSGGDCLAPLAEPARDFVFLVDDSASMREHKHRIIKAVESLSWLLKRYDDDGIDIYFMRSKQKAHARRKSSSDLIAPLVTAMADASGTSDVTLRLESLLHEYCEDYKRTQDLPRTTSGLGLSRFMTGRRAQQRIKPRMIYIFTNAIWQEASDPTSIIKEAASRLDDMHAPQYQLGIQFISVGASRENQRKLDRLDRGLGLPRSVAPKNTAVKLTDLGIWSIPNPSVEMFTKCSLDLLTENGTATIHQDDKILKVLPPSTSHLEHDILFNSNSIAIPKFRRILYERWAYGKALFCFVPQREYIACARNTLSLKSDYVPEHLAISSSGML